MTCTLCQLVTVTRSDCDVAIGTSLGPYVNRDVLALTHGCTFVIHIEIIVKHNTFVGSTTPILCPKQCISCTISWYELVPI